MKFLLPIISLCYLHTVTSLFCYWNTGCPYKYFSSGTPYNMIRGDIRDSLIKLTDCEPVSIWGLMRHGKRNPNTTRGKQMKEGMFIKDYVVSSYENGNSSLCAQDVENLRAWSPDKEIFDKMGQLSNEGYQEMVGIGRRLRQAFPKLLGQLDKKDYTFRSAKENDVKESIKGFVEGLGNKRLSIDKSKEGYDDIVPYETCEKYVQDVKNNEATYSEAKKYQAHSEFLASKDRIQRRLGIHLTDVQITVIWDYCRYTSSGLQNKFSPWCALFTTDDLQVLEYNSDLRRYYNSGYGTPMNKMFGEIVLSDLLRNFRDTKTNGKKITAYVTHKTMINMAYTALGLFKDANHLTGTERKADRKWRTSKFSTFSSNLIAVLNKCGAEADDNYNVVFYLNEEPLRTICKEGVCTWKEFEDKLAPFLETDIHNTGVC